MPILFFILCFALNAPPIFVHSREGLFLNCGASKNIRAGRQEWILDDGFISVGNKSSLKNPKLSAPLSTLRYFPDPSARKYCYVIPATKGTKYLVRTTYFYGFFDGGKTPPVFDQIVEGTKWDTVDTTSDFASGMSTYYEIVVAALGETISVCLARNDQTQSSPFISSLEVNSLESSIYNSTDFESNALITVARHAFGNKRDLISFPDDPYNRYWQSFLDENPSVISKSKVTPSNFWNLPPLLAFETAVTTSRGKVLEIQWPQLSLSPSNYYISLYFQDNRTPSPYSWRVFDVSINGEKFNTNVNVTTDGIMLYSSEWPLSGSTRISMTPAKGIPVGPIISAGEILQLLPLGGRTFPTDVSAMESMAKGFLHKPSDWNGDPCLPLDHSWTGISCSHANPPRVTSLNLTGFGVSGLLSPSVGSLTALTRIFLAGNRLSGLIPEMNRLTSLEILDLDDNEFVGAVPASFGRLPKLRNLSIQNNRLDSASSPVLKNRPDLGIR